MSEVTAVVAAYNEAPRIAAVLDVLVASPILREVVVVDDGSTDDTAVVAERHGARVLRLDSNCGKGRAMDVGVAAATTDVIFFADADVHGLTAEIVEETCRPVLDGECEMFVLMLNRKVYVLRPLMSVIPLLGGGRAITRRLWTSLPQTYKERFRIEVGLNFYAIHHGAGLRYRVVHGIGQTRKEEKFGRREGRRRRWRMYRDVVTAAWSLQWHDLPEDARRRRWQAAGVTVVAALGMLLGMLLVVAALVGPGLFFARLFAEALVEDPGAWVPRAVLQLVSGTTATAVGLAGGAVLAANLLFLLHGMSRLLTIGRVREPG